MMKRADLLRSFMWAVLLLVPACSSAPDDTGGRGDVAVSPGDPVTTTAEPGLPSGRPVILAFGDSLTAGHMVEDAMSYPSQLAARLEAEGYEYLVVNDGESGLTTSGGLARLERALALEPDIVILALGGNDGLRGTPVSVAHENLRTLIRAFRDVGAIVVLGGITLPLNYGPDYISDFENMYEELVEEFDVEHIPFLLEGLVDLEHPTDTIGTYMQSDGIHPTAEGYTIVAETVFRAIEPYLDRE